MPAACSLSFRLSTRKASTTMSCVAEAVATNSAPMATANADCAGSQAPRKTIAAMSQNCESRSQPRRRPEEFDRVGRADQRKQPDGAEIDFRLGHPHEQRRARQRERQARRKPEKQ